jgi:hypothetical protein
MLISLHWNLVWYKALMHAQLLYFIFFCWSQISILRTSRGLLWVSSLNRSGYRFDPFLLICFREHRDGNLHNILIRFVTEATILTASYCIKNVNVLQMQCLVRILIQMASNWCLYSEAWLLLGEWRFLSWLILVGRSIVRPNINYNSNLFLAYICTKLFDKIFSLLLQLRHLIEDTRY